MIVMMRHDFRVRARSLSPEIGSSVHNMEALVRYRVLFMWCRLKSIVVFVDWGGPFPDGIDFRLCEIIDNSIDASWRVGRYSYGDDQEIMLWGPDFWVTDYYWYERLLDGDERARSQYFQYRDS